MTLIRYKNWLWVIVLFILAILQVSVGFMLGLDNKEVLNFLAVLSKLFNYWDGPDIPWGAGAVISLSINFALSFSATWLYFSFSAIHVFPKLRDILNMYEKRKSEMFYVAKDLLDKELVDHLEMLKNISTRAGWAVVTDKIIGLSHSFLNNTKSKKFAMTTLGSAEEIFKDDGFRNFNKDFIKEVCSRRNDLQRFYVTDTNFQNTFDLTGLNDEKAKAMRWFVADLHNYEFTKLYYISITEFQAVVGSNIPAITRDMLDVLMFDGQLVSGIKNDPNTYRVTYAPQDSKDPRRRCYLYAIDDDAKLDSYRQFFNQLVNHCEDMTRPESGEVIKKLREKELAVQYGIR